MAYLARTLKPTTINCYLNIIRILHLEANFDNPMENNFELLCLKRGIARAIGSPPSPKLGITPELLMKLFDHLNLDDPADRAFWFAILIGFYGFLRKASLVPLSGTVHGNKCLLLSDFFVSPDQTYIKISVRFTKTIQFQQRTLTIPMCATPDNKPLCPVTAWRIWHLAAPKSNTLPLFSYNIGRTTHWDTHASLV